MKLRIASLVASLLLAPVVSAAPPEAKLLGPNDSLEPIAGTSVLLLSFNTAAIKAARFSPAGKSKVLFKHSEVPAGPQLFIWRVPPGEYCMEKFYMGEYRIEPDPDDMLCFSVVEYAINYPGTIWYVWGKLGYSVKPDLLIPLIKERRPDLLAKGFSWHLGGDDPSKSPALSLRSVEADAYEFGIESAFTTPGDPTSATGLRLLGDKQRLGDKVPVDRAKALDFYIRSADAGDARAAGLVCQQLDLGLGVPEDQVRAVKYCRIGVERGDALSTWMLGRMHARSRGGLVPDPAEQARLKGKLPDDAVLARIVMKESWKFEDSANTYPDGIEALRLAQAWYEKGDQKGDKSSAAMLLGLYYKLGIGTPVDGTRAIEHYEAAAALGSAQASVEIGFMYWGGKIVPRDLLKARTSFERAVKTDWGRTNALTWFLAVVDDPSVRDGKRALKLQKQFLLLYKENAGNIDTLAAAYAAAGDFGDAVESQGRAIELAKKAGWTGASLDEFYARLELYKAKKGYALAVP